MSIVEFARNCEICANFLAEFNAVMDINNEAVPPGFKSKTMYEMAANHLAHEKEAHYKLTHKRRKQYAFTFTTNADTQIEIQKEMCLAAWKLFTQKTVPVKEGEVFLEYTTEGRPHLHGWYESEDGGRLFAKIFSRVWPAWKEKRGFTRFPGGYHEEMKTNRYKGYAQAENRCILRKLPNENPHYYSEEANKWNPA